MLKKIVQPTATAIITSLSQEILTATFYPRRSARFIRLPTETGGLVKATHKTTNEKPPERLFRWLFCGTLRILLAAGRPTGFPAVPHWMGLHPMDCSAELSLPAALSMQFPAVPLHRLAGSAAIRRHPALFHRQVSVSGSSVSRP